MFVLISNYAIHWVLTEKSYFTPTPIKTHESACMQINNFLDKCTFIPRLDWLYYLSWLSKAIRVYKQRKLILQSELVIVSCDLNHALFLSTFETADVADTKKINIIFILVFFSCILIISLLYINNLYSSYLLLPFVLMDFDLP